MTQWHSFEIWKSRKKLYNLKRCLLWTTRTILSFLFLKISCKGFFSISVLFSDLKPLLTRPHLMAVYPSGKRWTREDFFGPLQMEWVTEDFKLGRLIPLAKLWIFLTTSTIFSLCFSCVWHLELNVTWLYVPQYFFFWWYGLYFFNDESLTSLKAAGRTLELNDTWVINWKYLSRI